MAERLAYLEAVVGADITQFRKGMRDIRNEAGVFSETMRGIAGAARTMTFAFTVPMVALGSMAVQTASKFDEAMRNINAIAGLSEQQFRDLSDATIEFGKNTRGGAVGAAEALYTVFSAGIVDVATAFDIMEVSTHTAEAGLADVTVTTEALIATMLSYQDTSRGFAEETSDAMTHMVAVGVGSMQDFATGIGKVIPAAGALGMSLEQLYGDMAFLTQRGMSAAVSSTALRQALISMAKPSEDMSSAFRQLGASSAEDLIAQFGGVNEAITALVGTTDGSLTEINALWTNIRGAMAIQQFANDIEGWNSQMDEFGANMAGATDRAWIQQMSSFAAAVDLMTSALSAAAIVLGRELMPFIRPVMEGIRNLALSITTMNPEVIRLIAGFGLVAAALPPIIWFLASLASPVGVLSVALITLSGIIGTGLVTAFGDFLAGSQPFKDDLQELSEVIERITGWDFMPDTSIDDMAGTEPIVIDPFRNITVTAPTSLWAIYEAEGYADLFTWAAFQEEMLTNGGWERGAILPDMNLRWPSGGITMDAAEDQLNEIIKQGFSKKTFEMDMPLVMLTGAQEILPPKTLLESIDMWSPMLISRFNTVWNDIAVWLNDKATALAIGMTKWFSEANMSGVYTAVQKVFGGDLAGALDAVIPGLGTQIDETLSALFGTGEGTFDTTKAAVGELGAAIGMWLLEDAIPALARSVGFVVGELGFMLRDGINFLLGSAGDAGDTAGAIGESVAIPFMQGFNDSITGHGGATTGGVLGNAGDRFVALLTSSIAVALLVNPKLLWAAPIAAIKFGLGAAFGTASFLQIGGIVAGKIGAGIAAALFALKTGTVMTHIGVAMINLVGAATALLPAIAVSLAVAATVGALVLIFSPEARASAQTAVAGFVDNILGEGSFANFEQGLSNAIVNTISGAFRAAGRTEDANKLLEMQYGLDDFILPVEVALIPTIDLAGINEALMRGFGADMGGAVLSLSPTGELIIDMSGFTILPEDEKWLDYFFADLVENATTSGDTTALDFFLNYFGRTPIEVPLPPVSLLMGSGDTTLMEMAGAMADFGIVDAVNEAVVTELKGFEQSPEAKAAMNTAMAAFAVTGVATDEEGNLTAQPIIDNYLIPLETAWIALFGEAGTMTVAFAEFTTVAITGFGATETAMIGIHDYAKVDFQEFPVFMIDAINPVVAAIENFTDAAEDALKAVKDLLDMKGNASIKISIETSGLEEPETDGSHAGGLSSVPFDGYIAELHKGEEVLTASAAAERRQNVPADVAYGRGGGNTTTTTVHNQYNINGVQDVDRFMAEMKRRGYKITND